MKKWRNNYKLNNKDKVNSPKNKIAKNMRWAISRSLHGGKRSKKTQDILGYTITELKRHLEKQFLSGMSWDNYGYYGWHIDHIKPIAAFNYTSIHDSEFKECWALDNLRPLWAKDNISKQGRWAENEK